MNFILSKSFAYEEGSEYPRLRLWDRLGAVLLFCAKSYRKCYGHRSCGGYACRVKEEVFRERNHDYSGFLFCIPFEKDAFDATVSVESLHHFTKEEKVHLYRKVWKAVTTNGYFILTDYFAKAEEEAVYLMCEFNRLKAEQEIQDKALYHFDTPLTIDYEIQALNEAGFSSVELLREWEATCTIKATK